MKVISTNLGTPTTITWNNKEVTTGIFKSPVESSIQLGPTDVMHDHVIDRKYHGGEHKACYLYGANHYPFWKDLYPELDWNWGMFGENITVDNCEEEKTFIGSVYQMGTAKVQVSQPRQPCFKLGIRFEDQGVLKQFVNESRSGVYFRVITPGEVKKGDKFQLIEQDKAGITVAQLYKALFRKQDDSAVISKIVEHEAIPVGLREYIAGLVG